MSALTRAKAELESARADKSAALRRVRDKAKQTAQANEHTILAAATAWGMGVLERKGTKVPTVKDLDPKLLYGIGGLAAAYFTKDARTKRVLQSVGDGLVGAWAYVQGKSPSGASAGYMGDLLGDDGEDGEI